MLHVSQFNRNSIISLAFVMVVSVFVFASEAEAQSKLEKVLGIKPRQSGFQYDRPTADSLKNFKLQKPAADVGKGGYVVVDGNGRIVRQFLDLNGDDRLDQWSYYKDGIEVYRDIDANYDNKTDQHRWMGTSGIRWGLDRNQNGEIDTWRMISAEEVASEVFESIKTGDLKRFQRVLLSPTELKSLQLSKKLNASVTQSLANAVKQFNGFARGQKKITRESKWVHFGTSQPNLVPAGNSSGQKDVVIYDHASAVFQNGRNFEQVAVGTIIQVGPNSWRAVELPQMVVEGKAVANGGIMFPTPMMSGVAGGNEKADPSTERMAKLYADLNKVESDAAKAQKQVDIETLEAKRAEIKTKLVEFSPKTDRVNWIESLADTTTDAFQRDRFPAGLTFLTQYQRKLTSAGQKNGLDYIDWRILNTKFSKSMSEENRRGRAAATQNFIEDMEAFAKKFPDSQFAAECLNNLGMHYEVSDRENPERAIAWFKKCATQFPQSNFGKKGAGAVRRLSSVGKKFNFVGKTVDGRTFNLQKQSKIVVVHYWETWCDVCIDDFEAFQRVAEKYKSDVIVVGANVDEDTAKFKAFMKKNASKVRWTQLHEPGGVEKSPLAHQLGPSSLPLVVLFDSEGKLIEAGLPADEVDREIQRLLRKKK